MTQDDKKALREFMRGFAFTISAVGIIILIISFIYWGDSVPDAKQDIKQDTKVVGTYKKCDVVRYTPDYSAKYYYFLDCSSKY